MSETNRIEYKRKLNLELDTEKPQEIKQKSLEINLKT